MAKKEGEGEGKEGKVDMKALTQSVMEGLKPVFLQIGQHIKAQSETITTLQGTVEKLSAGGDGTDDGDHKVVVDDGKPLEELSRQELADSIVARVAKEVIGPMQSERRVEREAQTRDGLKGQVHAANEAHPDFSKWHLEIQEVIKSHPTMNVEEAYQLARSQNGEKAVGIDAELKTAADEKVAADKKAEKAPSNVTEIFGGLLPTSGIVTDKEDGGLTTEEASKKAWDECSMSEHLTAVSE